MYDLRAQINQTHIYIYIYISSSYSTNLKDHLVMLF